MPLHIQDPTDPDSDYLIDALLDACQGAHAGGGAFAFLSSGGVRLFLADELFAQFIDHGSFEMLVGVDAITDTVAIGALAAVQRLHPNLAAHVLVPRHARSIFHPKVAWFDHGDRGILLTGSGNLTAGGLRWNIEAYTVQELDREGIAEVREQWEAFRSRCAAALYAPDDPYVAELLARNAAKREAMRQAGLDVTAEVEAEEVTAFGAASSPTISTERVTPRPLAASSVVATDEVPPITQGISVLVAEIPKASSRWSQANFDQSTFTQFFGASLTVQRRAYLFHLRGDGTLGHQEVRPAVAVASHNYRFELDAASGLAYPGRGRPIGVFARVAARTFVYMLLMPGSAGHSEMASLLATSVKVAPGRMHRKVFDAADVRSAWPASPLWKRLTI